MNKDHTVSNMRMIQNMKWDAVYKCMCDMYILLEANEEVSVLYGKYMEKCYKKGKPHKSIDSWIRHRGIGIDKSFSTNLIIYMKDECMEFSNMKELALFCTFMNKKICQ